MALKLYAYNMRLSASMYGPLHMLEVTLRNTIDQRLRAVHGQDWFANPAAGLTRYQLDSIASARQALLRQGKSVAHDPIVAELNFGFWASFFGKQAYRQWQHLRPAFNQPGLQRATVADMLEKLRDLRNRIAHHEPILKLPLELRYAALRDLVDWMEPEAALWIDQTSTWATTFLGAPTLATEPLGKAIVVRPELAAVL